MTILLVTLAVVAVSAIVIGVGLGMTGNKARYQPMPVARYQKYVGSNPNHFGDN